MKKFDKLYKTIIESMEEEEITDTNIAEEETEVKPTCAYCGKPVSKEEYEKQKEYHDQQTPKYYEFEPNQCTCEKCAEELMKM